MGSSPTGAGAGIGSVYHLRAMNNYNLIIIIMFFLDFYMIYNTMLKITKEIKREKGAIRFAPDS